MNSLSHREEEYIAFFREHYSSLCFFANTFLKDSRLSEDIVIDVSAKIWERRETLRYSGALKSYFYTSIRNACLRYLHNKRHAVTNEELLNDTCSLQERTMLENMIHTEMLQQIEKTLGSLPAQCRKVFTKLYIEGKTVSETADELQLSTNTIKTHRRRGLKMLRDSISFILLFAAVFLIPRG